MQGMGTTLSAEEAERVDELLEDGYAVLLVPMGEQVVISVVDLAKLARFIDPS